MPWKFFFKSNVVIKISNGAILKIDGEPEIFNHIRQLLGFETFRKTLNLKKFPGQHYFSMITSKTNLYINLIKK